MYQQSDECDAASRPAWTWPEPPSPMREAALNLSFAPPTNAEGWSSPWREARVAIVDEDPLQYLFIERTLQRSGLGRCQSLRDSADLLARLRREQPDLVIWDADCARLDSLDLVQAMHRDGQLAGLPVLFIAHADDPQRTRAAYEHGATQILLKPLEPTLLAASVRSALRLREQELRLAQLSRQLDLLVRQRTFELEQSRRELIRCLGRAGEYHDNDTSQHTLRVGQYAGVLARQLGLEEDLVDLLTQAAQLHDLGKIGIPDELLRRPGRLEPCEFEVIKEHCALGERVFADATLDEQSAVASHAALGFRMLADCQTPVLRLAARIASTHHEKWDGTGYPAGLRGEEIPLEGRLTAVADVFDALSTVRPYKPAFPLEQCYEIIRDGRGTHFDPRIVDAFFAAQLEIEAVYAQFAEEAGGARAHSTVSA